MQVDMELALVNAPSDQLKVIQDSLPPGFFVEDRSDRGWGLVICILRKPPDDIGGTIENFLQPLRPMVNMIGNKAGVLRIGIFYDTATCTMTLNSCDRLTEFGLSLEISVYPALEVE